MTYGELLEKLYKLSPQRLLDTVTVWDSEADEFMAVQGVEIAGADNVVLDDGHLFLVTVNRAD